MILQDQSGGCKTPTPSMMVPLSKVSFDDCISSLAIQIQQQVNPRDVMIIKAQDGANKTYPLSLIMDEMVNKRIGLIGQPIVSLPQEKVQFHVGSPFIKIGDVIVEPNDFTDLLCANTIQSLFYLCACESIKKSQVNVAFSMNDDFISSETFIDWIHMIQQLTDYHVTAAISSKQWLSLIETHHDFTKLNFLVTVKNHHDLHHFKTFNHLAHLSINTSVETLKHWNALKTWPDIYQMLKILAIRYTMILDGVSFANDFMIWNQDGIFDMAQGPYVGAKVILLSNE